MAAVDAFLEAVLGAAGAAALKPLAKADPGLAAYLPARAALAWLSTIESYEGDLPGIELPIGLSKNADGWMGSVGEMVFCDESAGHVAAAILHALDAAPGRPDLRDLDLARLGKTVDALAKAQARKGAAAGADTNKPAQAIPPQQPDAPLQPQATQGVSADASKPQKKPKLPRPSVKPQQLPKAKLTLSEANKACGVCGKAQFAGGTFQGCRCFASLSKSVTTKPVPGGYELSFGAGWDRAGVLTFLETVR